MKPNPHLKVLIADDDEACRCHLSTLIRLRENPCYTIALACDGDEGWQILEQGGVDIAIIDVRMPRIDGLTLVRRMKEHPVYRFIPVVMYTGFEEEDATEIAFTSGADDFLIKPINTASLHARLIAMERLRAVYCELQETNQELRDNLASLQHSQQQIVTLQKMEAIGQLAAGIAHEINTPAQYVGDNLRFLAEAHADRTRLDQELRAVCDMVRADGDARARCAEVEALADEIDVEFLEEEVPRSLDQAIEGIGRIATIVRAMRDFAHPSQGRRAAADLNRLVESTTTVSRNEYKYVADLVLDLDTDLPSVVCDEDGIKQVVLNLVVNASHAIEERRAVEGDDWRGTITLSTRRRADGWVALAVADTGVGIPATILHRIYEPFFTTKEVGRGTGQGLAIIHKIVVKEHKGDIDATSTPGQGTMFTILLPLDAEEDDEPEAVA